MHITLETDYAFRIVDTLVKSKKRVDAKTISERTDVSVRFALKILRKLVKSGIIKSFKGSKGGYELAKSPEEITLYSVVQTIEGEYVFSRCLSDNYQCFKMDDDRNCDCGFRKKFRQISDMVEEKLTEATFDQFQN